MQGGLKEEHEPDSGQCWEADQAASLAQGEVRQAEAGGGSTVCPLVLRAQVTSSHGRGCRPRDSGVFSGEHRTDLDLNSTIEGGGSHLLPHFVSLGCLTVSLKPCEAGRASIIIWTPF